VQHPGTGTAQPPDIRLRKTAAGGRQIALENHRSGQRPAEGLLFVREDRFDPFPCGVLCSRPHKHCELPSPPQHARQQLAAEKPGRPGKEQMSHRISVPIPAKDFAMNPRAS
jgi:hypothetical protein